jgi:putative oxidoreductase
MQKLLTLAQRLYLLLIKVADMLQPVILLVFRLTWGWQFFISGKGKLVNHGDIVEFFTSLGIPLPDLNAWFVAGLECVGGILLILGLASRPIGLMLTVNMIVAYLSVSDDREKVVHIFKDLDPFLQADPFFFLLTALLVFAFGPGMFSLDYILSKTVFRNANPKLQPATETVSSAPAEEAK